MAILNPEHLLEQAERLIEAPPAGPPRQVDLRRAVSACYYAVFHATLAAGADEFVGASRRQDPRYALVYRSVDHGKMRDLCIDLKKSALPAKYSAFVPTDGIGADLIAFAAIFIDLQDRRHAADYDPAGRLRTKDALLALRSARTALRRFEMAHAVHRRTFLTLLLFPVRR